MKLSYPWPLLLFILLLTVVACGSAGSPSSTGGNEGSAGPRGAAGAKGDAGSGGGTTGAPEDRLIVRDASLIIYVDDVAKATDAVVTLAAEMGGFVVSSRLSGQDTRQTGAASIRVPSDRFEAALERVRALAARVDSESTDAKDVTEEYVDLKARLRNLQATEAQYQRLMDRATTVDDVIKVQRQLTDVQGQAEQLQGRIQYLGQTSSTSLINVTIYATVAAQPIVQPGWDPGGTARRATHELVAFGQGLADIGIWLVIFLSPVWGAGVIVAAVFLVRWQLRRKRNARNSPPPG